jgi:hypothetical protein
VFDDSTFGGLDGGLDDLSYKDEADSEEEGDYEGVFDI